eukprot:scaffold328_cov130-Cylindrotheca_fusiformis.AAC.29
MMARRRGEEPSRIKTEISNLQHTRTRVEAISRENYFHAQAEVVRMYCSVNKIRQQVTSMTPSLPHPLNDSFTQIHHCTGSIMHWYAEGTSSPTMTFQLRKSLR